MLQTTKGLLHVSRLDGLAILLGRIEEASFALALALTGAIARGTTGGASATTTASFLLEEIFGLFHLEGLLGQGLDDLKGQEPQNVDDVVVGLAVRDDAEAGPLAETLALAEGEGGLATLGPVDVLLARHVLGALVGLLEPLQRREVHLFLLFILLVLALRHALAVEARDVPRQPDLGLLVLLARVRHRAAAAEHVRRGGVVPAREVGRVAAALVVRGLDVLAHVLPREEGAQTRHLGLVVPDQEDEVVRRDGARSTPGRQSRALGELDGK